MVTQMSDTDKAFHLLLVENSRTARAVMTKFLGEKGYELTVVPNGKASIEAAKAGGIDLIIMDLYMPQMNGYEATKHIRALPGPESAVPIIALTASLDGKDEKICEEAGMNKFVQKSSDNQDLLDTLAEFEALKNK